MPSRARGRPSKRPRADWLIVDMCAYNQFTTDPGGRKARARSPTGLLSNTPAARVYLNKRCGKTHEHWPLQGPTPGEGRRTRLAQAYSPDFARAFVGAIQLQKPWDATGVFMFAATDKASSTDSHPRPREEGDELKIEYGICDITDADLHTKDVRRGRDEELPYYRDMNAFEVVPAARCWASTGTAPQSE